MTNFIKNKKGTILPVTIVSMFIMIVIAFTCIKMFLVQNVMSTSDQLKVRTFYAAEGAMERQKMIIYKQINDINNNPKIKIGENTSMTNDCTIINLETTGGESNFKDFKIGNLSNVVYGNYFLDEDNMYPQIKVTSSIISFNNRPWLSDCGVSFYKKLGVNKTESDLKYGDYIDLNTNVYDILSDKYKEIDVGLLKKGHWFAVFNTTGKSHSSVDLDDANMLKRIDDSSLNETIFSGIKAQMESAYSGGDISFCVYRIDYVVKNDRHGYVIKSGATAKVGTNSSAIDKIPTVTCNMDLYFDIFLTKLYRRYTVERYYTAHWYPILNWVWTYTSPNSPRYKFVDSDYYKCINNIKFHIQKWEVLN